MKKLYAVLIFVFYFTCSYSQNQEELRTLVEKGNFVSAYNIYTNSEWVKTLSGNTKEEEIYLYAKILFENLDHKKLNELKNKLIISGDTNKMVVYPKVVILIERLEGNLITAQNIAANNLSRFAKNKNKSEYLYFVQQLTEIEVFMERTKLSEKLASTLLSKVEEDFSKKDPIYTEAILILASQYLLKADLNAAIHYLDQAEFYLKSHNLENSTDFAKCLILQAEAYLKKGEPTVTYSYLKKSEAILKDFLIEGHPLKLRHALLSADLANSLLNFGKQYNLLLAAKSDIQNHYPNSENQLYNLKTNLSYAELLLGVKKVKAADSIISTIKIPDYLESNSPDKNRYNTIKAIIASQNPKVDALYLFSIVTENIEKYYGTENFYSSEAYLREGKQAYKIGNYKAAIELFHKVENAVKSYGTPSHSHYLEAQSNLALIYWANGHNKKALYYFLAASDNYVQQFNKVFSFLSEKEKNMYYSEIREFFDRFNSFMLVHYPNDSRIAGHVFNHRLSNKAILFNTTQELRTSIKSSNDEKLIANLKEWNSLREDLAKVYKLQAEGFEVEPSIIEKLEEKCNEMEEYIQLKTSILKSKEGQFKKTVTWIELQRYLKSGEALVEFIRIPGFSPDSGGIETGKINYAALVLTKSSKKSPELVVFQNGEAMEGRNSKYYRNAIRLKFTDTLSYKTYFQPLLNALDSKKIDKLYISPDGIYNQINLNTLFVAKDSTYLVDRYRILMLTSTRDIYYDRISTTKKSSKIPENSYLIGFPDYYYSTIPSLQDQEIARNNKHTDHDHKTRAVKEVNRISSLPGTKTEVQTIKDLLHDDETHFSQLYIGQDANEHNIKAISQPGILHIATHGFFTEPNQKPQFGGNGIQDIYNENPLLLCGILLSGAGYAYHEDVLEKDLNALKEGVRHEDGILTAYEAMNLDLEGLDLAILSACETGLGTIQNGEGVYGFQRSLQTAGAKVILMSLWKVDDNATQQLMVYFYQRLKETGKKLESFEYAQKKIKEEFKYPVYWGAFIMIGLE